jgi:dihydroorotate dehydrogenase electron transfer subunit
VWFELEAPDIAAQAAPGQFVMVGLGATHWGSPFLPRPNSVAAASVTTLGLLIRAYGEGSRRLAALRPDDCALVLGPLGLPFGLGGARHVLCVAGGVGLAPFLFLPRWARQAAPGSQFRLLYGEREAEAVFDPEKIQGLAGVPAEIWTEDGRLGRRGLVTEGVDLEGVDLVLACGPTAMLKAVRRLALDAGVPCQLSVEEHMACGLGTCIGCAIETLDPQSGKPVYSLVCMDGPIFPAERLRW